MQEEQIQISVGMAAAFYGFMALIAWLLASFVFDIEVFWWHDRYGVSIPIALTLGVTIGLIAVAISHWMNRFSWAKELANRFSNLLGNLRWTDTFALALASSVGEEMLFRGVLQQVLSELAFLGAHGMTFGLIASSLIFGLVHTGPDRRAFLPWTVMALVMGFVLGGLYWYTGNLAASITTHFVINFINLTWLARRS